MNWKGTTDIRQYFIFIFSHLFREYPLVIVIVIYKEHLKDLSRTKCSMRTRKTWHRLDEAISLARLDSGDVLDRINKSRKAY